MTESNVKKKIRFISQSTDRVLPQEIPFGWKLNDCWLSLWLWYTDKQITNAFEVSAKYCVLMNESQCYYYYNVELNWCEVSFEIGAILWKLQTTVAVGKLQWCVYRNSISWNSLMANPPICFYYIIPKTITFGWRETFLLILF